MTVICCCRTVDIADRDSSSFSYVSSVDAGGSGDSIASPPCTTSVIHTVATHCPETPNKHGVDGLQVIAESPKVAGAGDDGYGDGRLEVCDSQTSDVEVHSLYTADEEGGDLKEHVSIEQTTVAAAANKSSAVECDDAGVDNDRNPLIPSASSSLSSFTITPCSSVTVDDMTVDSSPYPVAVSSSSELPLCAGFNSNVQDAVLAASSNTCSTQLHRPMHETVTGLKVADTSAVSHTVNALDLSLLATESASSVLHHRRYSAPEVVNEGHNSSMCKPEQAVGFSSNPVDFLPKCKHEDADDVGSQLHEDSDITEYHSANAVNNQPSHIPSVSAAACDFMSLPTSGVTRAAVDNNKCVHDGTGITEHHSADDVNSLPYHISSVHVVAPVINRASLPVSGASEGAVVDDKWSRNGCDVVKVHQTNDSSLNFPSPPESALMNADIKMFVSPRGEQTVSSTVQCAVNGDDISAAASKLCLGEVVDNRNGEKSFKAADASRLNINNFVALKQVRKPFLSSHTLTDVLMPII